MFCGDLHGDLDCAERVVEQAVDEGCSEVVQCGDWGFIWPSQGPAALKALSECLVRSRVMMRFVDGNHDHHLELRKTAVDEDSNVAANVTYQHRGSLHEYPDGTRVAFMGGAPSIDKAHRIPGRSWWAEEYVTDDDVALLLRHAGTRVDVLVTHDAVERLHGLKVTNDAAFNQRADQSHAKISHAVFALGPTLHVHGHWHHRYERTYRSTHVIGLASNINRYPDMTYVWSSDG